MHNEYAAKNRAKTNEIAFEPLGSHDEEFAYNSLLLFPLRNYV